MERQLRHARETLKKAHAALNTVTRDLDHARADEVKKTEALAQVRQSRMAFEEALERAQDAAQVATKKVSELERSSG